jgi:hypothetical protein
MDWVTVAVRFSPGQTLEQRVRIPLEAWIFVRVSSKFVFSRVDRGLRQGWSFI